MIDYLYDGSFDGLLTVIWHHYYTDRAAGIFLPEKYQLNLLHGSMEVETDPTKADKVYAAIRDKISKYDLRDVYRAWLSCDPEKEMKILRYVVLGFSQGHRTSSLHGNPVVADFQGILQKISQESERMLQFVRFSVVKVPGTVDSGSLLGPQSLPGGSDGGSPLGPQSLPGGSDGGSSVLFDLDEEMEQLPAAGVPDMIEVLYARIEPDNDVIELAAKHFSERFRNERVIIHDVGRDKAVIAWHGRWIVSAFAEEDAPRPSAEEMQFRRLWKGYFDHIAIMERKNTRCQNHFIPDRYRKHLTEIITVAD